jgi:hypothetical protein
MRAAQIDRRDDHGFVDRFFERYALAILIGEDSVWGKVLPQFLLENDIGFRGRGFVARGGEGHKNQGEKQQNRFIHEWLLTRSTIYQRWII